MCRTLCVVPVLRIFSVEKAREFHLVLSTHLAA